MNGNAISNTTTGTNPTAPVVDVLGNPVKPAAATGDLMALSLYGRDPLRPATGPDWTHPGDPGKSPLPNFFETGDGLNTAGYRFVRHTAASMARAATA